MNRALVVGAALALVIVTGAATSWWWNQQLVVQLAAKDRDVAALQASLDALQASTARLSSLQRELRGQIDTTVSEMGQVARSQQTSIDRLRSIILRLEALQAWLATQPILP